MCRGGGARPPPLPCKDGSLIPPPVHIHYGTYLPTPHRHRRRRRRRSRLAELSLRVIDSWASRVPAQPRPAQPLPPPKGRGCAASGRGLDWPALLPACVPSLVVPGPSGRRGPVPCASAGLGILSTLSSVLPLHSTMNGPSRLHTRIFFGGRRGRLTPPPLVEAFPEPIFFCP